MLSPVIKFLALLAFIIFASGAWRTWQIQHDSRAKTFLGGTLPNPKPDGLYSGTVSGQKVSWLGKKFNSASSTGVNVFDDGGAIKGERYPFITSVGRGLVDSNLYVLKIDYNIPGNPFWLRFILDEIVQVAPNEYLGKLEVRIIPGYPFALAYFELKK